MTIQTLLQKVLDGGKITSDEALFLAQQPNKQELYAASHQITRHVMGEKFDACSIINARSGNCSEDCKWCAQSRFYKTDIDLYPLVSLEETLRQANCNASQGIGRFSLVTSGRNLNSNEVEQVARHYDNLKQNCNIKRCASLGLLTEEDLKTLKKSGVETYHCNLETAPSYFSQLCTTHTPEEKIKTLNAARNVGMKLCSGGIIGMGESVEHRIELAITLRDLDVFSIPINVLSPIKGTPLENQPPLSEEEILTTIALFRFIHPKAYLRFSGGRAKLPKTTQFEALKVGINAAIMGDMLTTIGSSVDEDKELIRRAGYEF